MREDICVNPACYRWGTPLTEFVQASRATGFTRVEVSIQQAAALADDLGGLPALRRWQRRNGVEVTQFSGIIPAGPVLPAPLLVDEPDFAAAVRDLDRRLAVAAALDCPRAAVVVNPRTMLPRTQAAEIALTRLDLLAARAANQGIRLAVEFIGVGELDPALDGPVPFVRDITGLVGLLDELNRPGVGVLLDLCHLYASGATAADLAGLAGRIEFVQVCDIPPGVPPVAMTDALRCLPGDGVTDFPEIQAGLVTAGYGGPLSIELFSPDLWRLTPTDAARRLFASTPALLSTPPGGQS